MDSTLDYIRMVNAVLAGVGLLWVSFAASKSWKTYPYTTRLFLLTMGFYVAGAGYGSAVGAFGTAPFSEAVIINLVAGLALNITMLLVTIQGYPRANEPDQE